MKDNDSLSGVDSKEKYAHKGIIIKKRELIKLRISIMDVLEKSIGSGGTTFSDFRNIEGLNGNYSMQANVYKRTGEKCKRCSNLIQRKKITGRSTHWCPKCQK